RRCPIGRGRHRRYPCRMSSPQPPRALDVLQRVFGHTSFRGEQATIVEHVAAGSDALVLMPTAGGKSPGSQLPSLPRDGTAIVGSPLIALMPAQLEALRRLGLRAAYLTSTLDTGQAQASERELLAGEPDLPYVAPERLLTPRF